MTTTQLQKRIALVQRRLGHVRGQHKLREQHQLLTQLRGQLAVALEAEALAVAA
jgi:hypothetical protein